MKILLVLSATSKGVCETCGTTWVQHGSRQSDVEPAAPAAVPAPSAVAGG